MRGRPPGGEGRRGIGPGPGPVTPALELRHCRALVAVADHGGPTRAAAALGVSQSTVSEALLALERAVGTPLLARGGRTTRVRAGTPSPGTPGRDGTGAAQPGLTPAGVALLPHARTLLAAADAALTAARTAAGDAPLHVALGTAESVSTYVLPPVLAGLRARWPRADVQVSTGLCHELRASVAAGRLDVALVLEPAAEPGVGPDAAIRGVPTAVLGAARLVLVAAPAGAAGVGAGSPPTPAALARAVLYTTDPGGAYPALLAGYFADHGVDPPRVRSVGSVDAVKRSVLDGGGADAGGDGPICGLLSAHAVAEELRAGVLAEVPLAHALPPVYLKAVLPHAAAPSPVVAALLDDLRHIDLRLTTVRPVSHPDL